MRNTLRTKDVMKAAGIGREALRFYESKGLIPKPRRTGSGYREYAPDTVTRLQLLKRAQAVGFSLKEISRLLSLKTGSDTTCRAMEKVARAKMVEIDEKIASLQKMKKALGNFADACDPGCDEQCHFLEHAFKEGCCE